MTGRVDLDLRLRLIGTTIEMIAGNLGIVTHGGLVTIGGRGANGNGKCLVEQSASSPKGDQCTFESCSVPATRLLASKMAFDWRVTSNFSSKIFQSGKDFTTHSKDCSKTDKLARTLYIVEGYWLG